MQVISQPAELRDQLRPHRAADCRIALVPTMGALHEGHLSLVQQARRAVGPEGQVVVSIFVNPLQFGPKEDFGKYPRPLERDLALCAEAGVDYVFAPSPEQMYSRDRSTYVDETILSQGMCGGSRPGHFRGVCTVVLKLFNIVQPEIAVFGRKDYQQLAIIRRMVRDLDVPVDIVAGETVREADGLALSSRNRYLEGGLRQEALSLSRALEAGIEAVLDGTTHGEPPSRHEVQRLMQEELAQSPEARLDYLEIVDAETLHPVEVPVIGNVILGAAFYGSTRLIDNKTIE